MIDFADFVFVDLGSGKGRALLMASEYPFREIVGVEIQAELNAIAEQNIERFHPEQQKCTKIRTICMDARDYEFSPEPLLLYLFNPFPEYVFETVLKNLKRSLDEHPRQAFIVYNTPFAAEPIESVPFLQKLRESDRYQIYRARSTARPK
jgi:tRNA1(Val) A37 N6-methylase TrmN6